MTPDISANSGLVPWCVGQLDLIIGWLEKRTGWLARPHRVALVLAAIALTVAFPPYEHFGPFAPNSPWIQQALTWQIVHPFSAIPVAQFSVDKKPGEAGIEQHLYKRTYRITIPVICHYTGLTLKSFDALQQVTSCFFLLFAFQIFLAIFKDRLSAFLAAAAVAASFIGQWSFYNFDCFDGLAYFLLMLILRARRPWAIPLLAVAAGFIDERTILAMPIIYLFQEDAADSPPEQWTLSPNPLRIATAVGVALYLVLRWALGRHIGTMADYQGMCLWMLKHNGMLLPVAFLLLFKGYSLLVGTSALVVARRRDFRNALLLIASITPCVVAGIFVYDLTRSLCYAYPCIFLCAWIVTRDLDVTALRRLCLCAAFLSICMPTYYILLGIEPLFPVLRLFYDVYYVLRYMR